MNRNQINYKELEEILGKKIEPDDFIPPVITDTVFKFLFGTEENKEFLKDLLIAILGMKQEDLEELTYQNTELLPNVLSEKKNYLDIRIKLKTGEEIDIEIQRFHSADILDRFLYYWANMFTKQLKIGQKYKDLNKCICINILEFKLNEFKDCHLTYHIYDDKYKSIFSDLLEIHLLELPKTDELQEMNKELYQWLKFIQSNSRREMKGMSKTSPMLEKAIARLETFNQDDDAYLDAVKEYFYRLDEANYMEYSEKRGLERGLAQGLERGLAQGLERGLAQGLERGLVQGRLEGQREGKREGIREAGIEIAKNLKSKNTPVSFIAEVTGLSKETIEKL